MLRTLTLITGLLVFGLGHGASVKPVSLEHMAQQAAVIFYGRVLSNEVKVDELSQRVATFTTFEILDAIKGVSSSNYTVKQIGGQLPGSNVVNRVPGVPRFTENQEYVVFLPEASRIGFASPIGLSQGSYSVSDTDTGKIVSNGRTHSTANKSANPADHSDQAGLENFLQSVRLLSNQ